MAGCAGGRAAPPGQIRGLSQFKVEEFRVWLRHDPASGLELRDARGPAAEIDLRVGDRFGLQDARRTQFDVYTLLRVQSGVAQLRLDRARDYRDQGAAIHRESRVLVYSSWPEEDESAGMIERQPQ